MFIDKNHFYDLEEIFKTKVYSANGTNEGVIIRYPYMYLRLYDTGEAYTIHEFYYGDETPRNTVTVPMNRLKEYASQFHK